MKLSVIVPAYNEEKLIARCVESILAALAANRRPQLETELIVVDNNSTDATARVASEAGARVAFEPLRQIARARNAGAAAATGDWFLFVDADSFPDALLIGDALAAMETGDIAGGGATVTMPLPASRRWLISVWNGVSRCCRWAAGSFIFCRADAFREIGGFNDELFASEEIDFSRRLKRWGRAHRKGFVILRDHPLETSARKMDLYTPRELLGFFVRYALSPRKTVRNREQLGIWYDGRR